MYYIIRYLTEIYLADKFYQSISETLSISGESGPNYYNNNKGNTNTLTI